NGLVGARDGLGAVPCFAIGIDIGIGRLCERAMCIASILEAGGAVDRRAHEGMAETYARTEFDESFGLGWRCSSDSDPQRGGCSPQQRRIADWFSGSDQEKTLGRDRELPRPL